MSQPELVELRKQLKEILESGIIEPTKSSYGAPVLFQKKADGSLRMCCDYQALNKITVKNKYPIPLVADCFDRLSRAKYFTKIDLRSGYWQVRIKEGMRRRRQWSRGIEHVEHLRQVLTRLREHELYAKVSKCSFAQETISFLGHIVERGRIRIDPKKVQAIEEWRPLSNVHDLRSFLGLANYYRCFVKGYSEIARPMTDLLKKTETWDWTPQCQVAFDNLKRAMLPLRAGSLKTSRRYSVHEKELLAVVHCLRLWRHYLLGSPFVVKTDNTVVRHFMTQPKLTSRQARWQELLSEFHFVLEYRAGSSNHVADALSRRADFATLGSVAISPLAQLPPP
ncbi:UNVERIFIED_CONTAM: Retrovirus-related Pol polyprotein from transposon gypsy [Sesamum calycinum]|uniref:Retrovirus-related Pol polyprotein from transposon gypsy n=1 Tax=Sesamum calycinum TaxID=2727403 RepID=A0AAW2LUZ1_9LAMI